jgi:hypothetical protein
MLGQGWAAITSAAKNKKTIMVFGILGIVNGLHEKGIKIALTAKIIVIIAV